MTRKVNFSSQQRVDQPDAQAMQTLATEDLRRHVRVLVMGGSDTGADLGRVVRGFLVEAEDPGVSTRVIVKLDRGAGDLGAFMAGIDQGAGVPVDWGQLGGDRDGANNLEGSAQNLLDFAGQPAATYTVKIRTVFVEGVFDNRAFWNPTTTSEFIKPTNTRLIPQWEIAFSGHADPEWVTLAEVDWDGAAVAANDIRDLRRFPIEGAPRNTGVAADRWSHPTQDTGGFGVGDFDRTEDRGEPGSELGGLWEMVRALARQVEDIKGARESDGRFDWFSRPVAPPGFLAADPGDESTRNLRSLETVTFTVADGTSDSGDFTGQEALYDCLKFIQDNSADLPKRIHVVVKSRDGGADFLWSGGSVTLTNKTVSIVGIGRSREAAYTTTPTGWGQVEIDPAATTATPFIIVLAGDSLLQIENLFLNEPPNGVGWIDCAPGAALRMHNCSLFTTDFDGQEILRAPSDGLVIDHCQILGYARLGGREDQSLNEDTDLFAHHGSVTNTAFEGRLVLRYDDPDGVTPADRFFLANNLTFEGCEFHQAVPFQAGGASSTGQVDVSGSHRVTFRRCEFVYHGDQNALHGQAVKFESNVWSPVTDLTVEDCSFRIRGSATHTGFLTGAGGVGGADGTGWSIAVMAQPATTSVTNTSEAPRGIRITGNHFESGLNSTDSAIVDTSPDAGCIYVKDGFSVWVERNEIRYWTFPLAGSASDIQVMILLAASIAGVALDMGNGYWCVDNHVGNWREGGASSPDWGGQFLQCLYLSLLGAPVVRGNVFSARNIGGDTIRVGNSPSATFLSGCVNPLIEGNVYVEWRDSVTPSNNSCVALGTLNLGMKWVGNQFFACGGANIIALTSAVNTNPAFVDNYFSVGADATKFTSAIDTTLGTTSYPHLVGNSWDYANAGGAKDFIRLDAGNAFGTIYANFCPGGNIFFTGGGGSPIGLVRGYAPQDGTGDTLVGSSADLNNVLAYT